MRLLHQVALDTEEFPRIQFCESFSLACYTIPWNDFKEALILSFVPVCTMTVQSSPAPLQSDLQCVKSKHLVSSILFSDQGLCVECSSPTGKEATCKTVLHWSLLALHSRPCQALVCDIIGDGWERSVGRNMPDDVGDSHFSAYGWNLCPTDHPLHCPTYFCPPPHTLLCWPSILCPPDPSKLPFRLLSSSLLNLIVYSNDIFTMGGLASGEVHFHIKNILSVWKIVWQQKRTFAQLLPRTNHIKQNFRYQLNT